jgi:hypothetical protein
MRDQKAIEEQEAAIKAAVEKATSVPHLRPLQAACRRIANFGKSALSLSIKRSLFNKATEAALAKATCACTWNRRHAQRLKSAIDAAVTTALATKEAEQKTKHDAAIEKAIDSGHLEGTMKLRYSPIITLPI